MEMEQSAAVISLVLDLFTIQLYWTAISALWFYDYFLTLPDEVEYAWKGKRRAVFWLFILNRYLVPCFIMIALVAYFAKEWTDSVYDLQLALQIDILSHFIYPAAFITVFTEALETLVTTFLAEVLLTFRVYVLLNRHKVVLFISGTIITAQWIIALYIMSQSSRGTDQVVLLLPVPIFPPPELPNLPPYHVCIFISVLSLAPLVEAWLCLSLAFDRLVFLSIMIVTIRTNRRYGVLPLMRIIQRDGIVYFFVLFSSNLVWLLLLLHARPALKFLHNQPAMVLSTIMINRITLNLKQSGHTEILAVGKAHTQFSGDSVELQKLGHITQSTTIAESVSGITGHTGGEQGREIV